MEKSLFNRNICFDQLHYFVAQLTTAITLGYDDGQDDVLWLVVFRQVASILSES